LPDLYRERQAHIKLRRLFDEELIWRAQYELLIGIYCLDRIPVVIKENSEKLAALLRDGRFRFDRINPNLFAYNETSLIVENPTDDEGLADQILEQKFEFNFTHSDVKDRVETINDLLTGEKKVKLG
jgi:hypothetical protein